MSIESARKLYMDLLEDPQLAAEVYAIEQPDDRWKLLSAKGYDFAQDEWLQVSREAQALVLSAKGPLSDRQLESVVGGMLSPGSWLTPTARTQLLAKSDGPVVGLMYGMAMPPGGA